MVLVHTDREERGALWLDEDFKARRWLAFEGKEGDTTAMAIAEVTPGQFIAVGMRLLHPTAVRFDHRSAARLALPWVDGPEGMLRDVTSVGLEGGFVVCGVEVRREGGAVASEVVMAVFDGAGSVRAQARLPGRSCGLLPTSDGRVRVLHDDGASEQIGLSLTTLDDALKVVSDESIVSNYAPSMSMLAFELGDRLFIASPWFASETLEIRGPEGRESIALGIDAGGMVDILPGPARVYVVSAPKRSDRRDGEAPFVMRVEAYDLETSSP